MTIKLTREEAIQDLKAIKSFERYARGRLALDIAIDALKHEQPDEWCDDCKEYDTEKKCCPRFNKVIREAMKRIPHEDGTLEVKVEDATKIGRVLITDDEHRGGLYYPDEDEPQGDLISRTEAYRRITELSRDLLNDDCINLGNASEYLRIIRELPSADRPTDGDLISRAEAAEMFEAMLKTVTDQKIKIGISRSWQQIKDLPSADRPRGEWIHTPNGIDRDFVWWTCSECGHKIFSETEKDRIEFHAYCGRCGADMRGEDE